MKKNNFIFVALLIVEITLTFVSCGGKTPVYYIYGTSAEVIDGCEYVMADSRMAHKGNCKFCAERRKEEQNELIEQIKKIVNEKSTRQED